MGLSRCSELETCSLWRILDVTRHFVAPLTLDEILSKVIEAALQVLEAERGTVFLYDPTTHELYSKVATGSGEIRFAADAGLAGEAAQKRELINVPDCYSDSRFNKEVDRKTGFVTRCLLSIPLLGIDDSLVGVLQVLNKRGGIFDEDDEHIARTLAAQCAVVLQRGMLLDEYVIKQKLERDLALARDIQAAALPERLPELEGYDLYGWARPADDTGGDIYDAQAVNGHEVAFLLGDATGHGIGPALSVTQVRAMFRMGLRLGSNIDSIFTQINAQLKQDLPSNRFVTAFIGLLDNQEHKLHYHSGGQAPLLHYRADVDECAWLDSTALPLGILPFMTLEKVPPVEMGVGDFFGLITDGILEYANSGGEQFGKEGVAAVVRANRFASAEEMAARLIDAVTRHSQGQPQDDDMTVVLIKRKQ